MMNWKAFEDGGHDLFDVLSSNFLCKDRQEITKSCQLAFQSRCKMGTARTQINTS